MPYSNEIVRKARAELASRKADHESRTAARLREAYAKVPRIREIDILLKKSMAVAMRTVFQTGSDAKATMEQVKQANLALQAEKAALIAQNFAPGWLEEDPICSRCGGSGYVGSTMCECLRELCRQEQKRELTFLNVGRETFEQFRLDYYPDRIDPALGLNIRTVMDKTLKTCRRYAMTFTERSGNLLFSGDTGLGKTFLSACIARTVADRGYSVVYESAGHMFTKLERAKFNGDEEARRDSEKFTACDLLIVDDLGTEMGGQFTTSSLYCLINDRILAGKATIISTNLSLKEMQARYSDRVFSRITSTYEICKLTGKDIRLQRRRRGRYKGY